MTNSVSELVTDEMLEAGREAYALTFGSFNECLTAAYLAMRAALSNTPAEQGDE